MLLLLLLGTIAAMIWGGKRGINHVATLVSLTKLCRLCSTLVSVHLLDLKMFQGWGPSTN